MKFAHENCAESRCSATRSHCNAVTACSCADDRLQGIENWELMLSV